MRTVRILSFLSLSGVDSLAESDPVPEQHWREKYVRRLAHEYKSTYFICKCMN